MSLFEPPRCAVCFFPAPHAVLVPSPDPCGSDLTFDHVVCRECVAWMRRRAVWTSAWVDWFAVCGTVRREIFDARLRDRRTAGRVCR
jgi:hypothetical protein